MRGRFLRTARGLLLMLFVVLVAFFAQAQEPPKQLWENLADYPARGLSPLYRVAGERCGAILSGNQRWAVLPRPIDGVLATAGEAPCFEMHNGDAYCNDLYGNAEAIRWAAEQSWEGAFRLFYNTTALARSGDEFWLTIDGFRRPLRFLSGSDWTSYMPLGSRAPTARFCYLARHPQGGWWIASREGLYRLDEGTLQRAKIPGWPGGAAQGVVGDRAGRIVAWSERTGDEGATVAFYADGQWSSVPVLRAGQWTQAGIRPDGSAVLAGPSQVVIVKPPSAISRDAESGGLQEDQRLEHLRQGHFPLGDDAWVQVYGQFAVGPTGNVLFAARKLPEGAQGFVRSTAAGTSDWIDFDPPYATRMTQIAPWKGGGFLIVVAGQGIYLLEQDSRELRQVAEAAEAWLDDRLLGCDCEGRAYLRRNEAILVFSPDHQPMPTIDVCEIARVEWGRRQGDRREAFSAAVDSAGACWFIAPDDRSVMVLAPDADEPHLCDDRLTDGRELWPGRDGAMLVIRAEGRAALAFGERKLELAESLVDLAREHFPAMLAAAPQSSRAGRRVLALARRRAPEPLAPPWLATGASLWLSDGKCVYRLRAQQDETETAQVEEVCAGNFMLLGPLRSGHLLLAEIDSRSSELQLTSWGVIEDPEGVAKRGSLASPPRERRGMTLTRPANFARQWYLDASGCLWLHQGFDRTYRIDSPHEWPMLEDFGQPEFEFPEGFVWGYHTARVFGGYEVAAGTGFRRSCIPAYCGHLTPLFSQDDKIGCLTPDGLALLRFDPDDPERDAVVHKVRVRWGKLPLMYVGHSGLRVFFILRSYSRSTLVAVDVPEPPQ